MMERVKSHALIFPYPAQGHINPMMQLAHILISRNVLVTFLNTDFNHQRLNPKSTDEIRFESFPDGLPPHHGRTLNVPELCESVQKHGPLYVERIVENLKQSATNVPPISFIVADGDYSIFMVQIAHKYGIPWVSFWTPSVCGFSAYFHMPVLMEEGYIPIKEIHGQSKDELISCIPEMTTLRVKDLPTFMTVTDPSDFMFQYKLNAGQSTLQASLVLVNSYEALEGPVLRDLNTKFSGKVLSIGPLLLLAGDSTVNANVWKEETRCLEWLGEQKISSVIFVSFGSITVLSDEELIEFAWGLEASNQPFLWAIRPDLVQGKSAVLPREFIESSKGRGFFVSWAPQTEVLSHASVGGFLTHSGWNSTIESISAGVPMICWPFFAEQQTNRRFVDNVCCYPVSHDSTKLPMEHNDFPLYTTQENKSFLYRVYACAHFSAIIGLIYYRIVYIPSEDYWPWILLFAAELGFAYVWILDQAYRWWPVERKVFSKRLSQRFESELPPVDKFICTADPVKEPPLTVINTVLSALALDYPAGKLSCYVSDDGGSPLTFYCLLEASRFTKIWLPFCDKYCIQDRCPEAYFPNADALENKNLTFTRDRKHVHKMYLELKDRINNAVEMGSPPADKQEEHKGFKDWVSGSTRRDHPSIVQILLEKGEDKDIQGNDLPSLIYVSREKRPGVPHHYKAGALNVLIRVSGLMSNAPFILTLDCDMYTNNSEALRQAMCFFLDPKTGHQFGFVQFPQCFHGITKNDLYANHIKTLLEIQYKGLDGIEGPFYIGTGSIHRRDALCGRERRHISSSKYDKAAAYSSTVCTEDGGSVAKDKASNSSKMLKDARDLANCIYEDNTQWGKQVGMIYGCAVEDILTGCVIQCRGWKSVYCTPKRKAFLGCAPNNLNDTLNQHKRWSVGHLELFLSKFCPYVHGIGRIRIAQRMCYSWCTFWSVSSMHILCYGLIPSLCMLRGLSLFPKVSSSCFFLFVSLAVSAYVNSLIAFIWIGCSFKTWWNEQRMWMIKGVSAYLFALIEVVGKMIGVSEVGFEVTNKVVDSEAAERYEAEIFEFGVTSALFVPPATLVLINLISLIGGLARILREGYSAFDNLILQLILCSFIVINGYPILEAMFMRKDRGRIPTSITIISTLLAVSLCSVASIPIR